MHRPLPVVIGAPLVLGLLGAAVGGSTFAVGGFWVGAIAVVVWALLDAIGQPRVTWGRASQNRALWIALLGGGLLLCGVVGYLAAVAYFASVRARLNAVA
jgi:hypothetical protein